MDENAILCFGILASKNVIFYQNKHLLERLDLHYSSMLALTRWLASKLGLENDGGKEETHCKVVPSS